MAGAICVEDYKFLQEGANQYLRYHKFAIDKGNGKKRWITAPNKQLKDRQRWLLRWLYSNTEVHPSCHGFVPGRSVVTNAAPHVKKDWVLNMDIHNFFPSTGYAKVMSVLDKAVGDQVLPRVKILLYMGRISLRNRSLPQGSPVSPYLANLVMYPFDEWASSIDGVSYTRYADDLTFSGFNTTGGRRQVDSIIHSVTHRLNKMGYSVAKGKTTVQRKHRRQMVTGVVVNERVTIPREKKRALRAFLHQADKWGIQRALRDRSATLDEFLGELSFFSMCDKEQMLPLLRGVL